VSGSNQTPQTANAGKSSSKTQPAAVAPGTSHLSPRVANWAADPKPKYELDQDELPAQVQGVTTSPESQHLGKRYVPGSAPGSEAPTVPRLRPTRGR
jgi:hypothetical protein